MVRGAVMSLLGIMMFAALGVWILSGGRSATIEVPELKFAQSDAANEKFSVPPMTDEYRNDELRFSIALPEGFTVGELPVDEHGGRTIILQNNSGEGIQIYTRPFDDIRTLTADMVQSDIPDMEISDVQTVEIGENHTGIAFVSDNEAFGGASREVWFVFNGTLYQISTYARLDDLLRAMFGTWKFF